MKGKEKMKTNEVIYISGAISGTSDYMERFEKAEAFLKGKGYKVINPAKVMCPLDGVLGYEDMMDIDMMLIERADIIFMLKGWRESKGANREYGLAMGKEKIVIEEEDGDLIKSMLMR